MAGTGNFLRTARGALVALSVALALAIAGSYYMGGKALEGAKEEAAAQAVGIVDTTLSTLLTPSDLLAPVDAERAKALDEALTETAVTASIAGVTIWTDDGVIVYSTDRFAIGDRYPEERDSLARVLRADAPKTTVEGDVLEIRLPLRLGAETETSVVAELDKEYGPIWTGSGKPWRMLTIVLSAFLVGTLFAVYRVGRAMAAAAANLAFRPSQGLGQVSQAPGPAHARDETAAREDAVARRRAEDRARIAEEQLAAIQEQHRRSLEELQVAQKRLREVPVAARPDAQLEERLLKAEGRTRLLEGQLQAMTTERDRLSAELRDAREAARPDDEIERRARQLEQEGIALRAELEGTRTELEVAKRELTAQQTRAMDLERAIESSGVELEELQRARDEIGSLREEIARLEPLREEVGAAREDAASARAEAEGARRALEARTVELEAVRRELESGTATLGDELERAAAEAEAARTEADALRQALAEAETRHAGEVAARDADSAARIEALSARLEEATSEAERVRANAEASAAELQGARDQLVGVAAELEATRSELAAALEELQVSRDEQMSLRERSTVEETELARLRAQLQAAAREAEAATAERDAAAAERDAAREERDAALTRLGADSEGSRALQAELDAARAELSEAQGEVQRELARGVELAQRAERAERELAGLRDQSIADPELEVALRETQERLAAAEGRVAELETELAGALERTDRRSEPADGAADAGDLLEDRRASTPFMKELSLDAKRTLTQILGLTLTLKHKKTQQEQAPLLRQLTAFARRLDHTVSDLAEADKLARGAIELTVRRTNLEALVERVVEESGIGAEYDVRVETEELVVGVDPLRTEQILNGLLRIAADRTSPGQQITVRLQHADGGALLSVEDREASSDGSMGPVVTRLAEVQGGWARVEGRPNGGSAFRVFLPDRSPSAKAAEAPEGEAGTGDRLEIVVDAPAEEADANPDPWAAGRLLMQELQRLSREE
jgi:hypothetical protein